MSKGEIAGIIIENTSDKSYNITFAFKLHGYQLAYFYCGDDEEEKEAKDGMVEHTNLRQWKKLFSDLLQQKIFYRISKCLFKNFKNIPYARSGMHNESHGRSSILNPSCFYLK